MIMSEKSDLLLDIEKGFTQDVNINNYEKKSKNMMYLTYFVNCIVFLINSYKKFSSIFLFIFVLLISWFIFRK
jgi:hypothetical protein